MQGISFRDSTLWVPEKSQQIEKPNKTPRTRTLPFRIVNRHHDRDSGGLGVNACTLRKTLSSALLWEAMTWDGLGYIWEQKGVIGGGHVSQDLAFYGVYLDKKV